MKTLKSIILGLVILFAVNAANAKNVIPGAEKISVNYAVSTYVNAMAHGKVEGLSEVIDNNSKFSMLRGSKMMSYSKAEIMAYFNTTANVEQDCKTSVAVNETNADLTVVKVSMQYKNFTRINYVTLANTVDGWKITNVYSVFK